ncbi:hypothetical protein Hdeb2414_s0014g00426041 [Helianthus debilis subsp. tardiflorus]
MLFLRHSFQHSRIKRLNETLRQALQRLYMTRASYRDALIQGYQEGIQQVMEKKDNLI